MWRNGIKKNYVYQTNRHYLKNLFLILNYLEKIIGRVKIFDMSSEHLFVYNMENDKFSISALLSKYSSSNAYLLLNVGNYIGFLLCVLPLSQMVFRSIVIYYMYI